MQNRILALVLPFLFFIAVLAVEGTAQTTYYLTTSGGSYSTEKWVSITTGANGSGTQVWGQGNGTYSNGAGLLTNEAINLTGYEGQTLYLNCYDKYDDTWDGTVYVLEETASGPTIINNGGASPTDAVDNDASSGWDGTSSSNHGDELETSESFTIPALTDDESDIIEASFDEPDNIDYSAYTTVSGLTTGNAIKVGSFTVRDGGSDNTDADSDPTTVTDITFTVLNHENITALALFDGTTNISEQTTVGTSTSFSSLTLAAGDEGTKTFDLYCTFETTVDDNEQIQFTINSATANNSGSTFATANAGGAATSISGDDNKIEVIATKLIYTTNTSNACANNSMSNVVVVAHDANNNLDLDYIANVTLSSTGTLSAGGTETPAAGVATFSGITHSATGTNLELTASSGGLTNAVSAQFDISNPATLTTTAVSSITSTTASSGGNITNDGGSAVTARGVCWSTISAPTTADSKTTNGSGTGSFVSSLTGLSANTTYYVRAYATTGCGDSYGNEVSFTTLATSSDIVYNDFDETNNVDYTSFTAASGLTTGNALKVGSFTIRDGGAGADNDAASTTLTDITFTVANHENITALAIFDGTTNLSEQTTVGASTSFGGLTISAADNGTKSFDLYCTFEATVVDNEQIQFTVNSATADATGSSFATGNAGGSTNNYAESDDNKIEVTASKLLFVQQPSETVITSNMSPAVTVEATDANNNRDLDYTSTIKITSTGTLSGTPVTSAAANGVATFSTLSHTVAGTNLTLSAERNGTDDWDVTSNTFNIIEDPDICSNAIDILGNAVTADLSSANNDATETDDGGIGESTISFGNGNAMVSCSGSQHSAYWYTEYTDLWYYVDIADGTDEFSVHCSGLSDDIMIVPYSGTCGSLTQMSITGGVGTGLADSDNDGNIETEQNQNPLLNSSGVIHFKGTEVATASTGRIYLRVISHDGKASGTNCNSADISSPSFTISVTSPQPNDVDGDAIEIDGTSSNGNLCLAAAETESTETGDACAEARESEDLWYKITAGGSDPSAKAKISITFTNATDAVVITEHWGAFSNSFEECVTLSSTGAGSTVSHTFDDDINAGNTNYYRVTPASGNAVCTFTIAGERVLENDACSYFENKVLPGYDLDNDNHTVNMTYASASGTGGIAGKDLWYLIDHNSNQSITVTADNLGSWTGTAAVYLYEYTYPGTTLDCDNLSLYCSRTGLSDFSLESGLTFNLGTGDYLVRLVETTADAQSDQMDFTWTGVSSATIIASNSSCSGALDVTSASKTGNFTTAKLACTSTNHQGAEQWYKFTMPGTACSGGTAELTSSDNIEEVTISIVDLENSSAFDEDADIIVYSSSCGGTTIHTGTIDESSPVTLTNLTSGQDYFFVLKYRDTNTPSSSNFTVSMTPDDAVPCNNDSEDAIGLTPVNASTNSDCNPTTYSAQGGDAWFTYVQPDNSGSGSTGFISIYSDVLIGGSPAGAGDLTIELYNDAAQDGTPDGVIRSANTDVYGNLQLQAGRLVVGNTYFIKLSHSEAANVNVQYDLCVSYEERIDECPQNTSANHLSKGTECSDDCELFYSLDLSDGSPSAYYRIEASYASGANAPGIVVYHNAAAAGSEGNPTGDQVHPCANTTSSYAGSNPASGTAAGASSCGTDVTWEVWDFIDQYPLAQDYQIQIDHHSSVVNCGGLDLCQVRVIGPFEKTADGLARASTVGTSPAALPELDQKYCAQFDYGDLEEGSKYPVTYSFYVDSDNDGFPDDGVWLGSSIDSEANDSGNSGATGDDNSGSDDEDGVSVLTPGSAGGTATIRVVGNAVAAGVTVHVGLWLDWDGDGFEAADFYTGSGVTASPVNIDINVNIPAGFVIGDNVKILAKAGKAAFVFGDDDENVEGGEIEGHVIQANVVLPVELTTFDAETKDNHNLVYWETASELNSDYFVVQRSIDSRNFENIGTLKAAGNSFLSNSYSFKDVEYSTNNYYRLKQVDFDGSAQYSNTILVQREKAHEANIVSIYPNPTAGILNLKFLSDGNDLIHVKMIDISGREVISKSINIKDNYLEQLDISNLKTGVYKLSIITKSGKVINEKVIKN